MNLEYIEFIKPELFVLIPVLYALGALLKKTEKIKDNNIPLILTGVGLFLSGLWVIGAEGFSAGSIFTSVVQGLLCTAGAVYGNQLIKQASKK